MPSVYKEKLLASLKAGEITDLQQKALRQEFITALEQEGFRLCQCSRQKLLCQSSQDNAIYVSLSTDQSAGEEAETPNTPAWGHWFLCDAAEKPLCDGHHRQEAAEASPACGGFWLEGIANIGHFIKSYRRHQG